MTPEANRPLGDKSFAADSQDKPPATININDAYKGDVTDFAKLTTTVGQEPDQLSFDQDIYGASRSNQDDLKAGTEPTALSTDDIKPGEAKLAASRDPYFTSLKLDDIRTNTDLAVTEPFFRTGKDAGPKDLDWKPQAEPVINIGGAELPNTVVTEPVYQKISDVQDLEPARAVQTDFQFNDLEGSDDPDLRLKGDINHGQVDIELRANEEEGLELKYDSSRPRESFILQKDTAGRTTVTELDGTNPRTFDSNPELQEQRAKLLGLAGDNISGKGKGDFGTANLLKFQKDMITFEERAKKAGIPPEQVKKVYAQVAKLLDPKSDSKVPHADRVVLAMQVMQFAGDPTSINQGDKDTCGQTSLQTKMFTEDPARAASIIASLADTGSFNLADGSKLSLPDDMVKPGDNALNHPPKDGDRTYATQLFNHAVSKTIGTAYDSPDGTNANQLADAYAKLAGPQDGDFVLTADLPPEDKSYTKGVGLVKSPQDLTQRLMDMQKKGKLPAVLLVNANMPPFWRKGDGNGNGDGGHAVTVTGIEPGPPPKVKIDDQNGKDADFIDKPIAIDDLYKAMHGDPDRILSNALDGKVDNPLDKVLSTMSNLRDNTGSMDDQFTSSTLSTMVKVMVDAKDLIDPKGQKNMLNDLTNLIDGMDDHYRDRFLTKNFKNLQKIGFFDHTGISTKHYGRLADSMPNQKQDNPSNDDLLNTMLKLRDDGDKSKFDDHSTSLVAGGIVADMANNIYEPPQNAADQSKSFQKIHKLVNSLKGRDRIQFLVDNYDDLDSMGYFKSHHKFLQKIAKERRDKQQGY